MRTAATANDSGVVRLESVLTARAAGAQFGQLTPATEQVDELSSPGPTTLFHVQLSSGHSVLVVFHETHDFIEVLARIEPGIEPGLADLLTELGLTPDAITWTADRIDRRAVMTRAQTAPLR